MQMYVHCTNIYYSLYAHVVLSFMLLARYKSFEKSNSKCFDNVETSINCTRFLDPGKPYKKTVHQPIITKLYAHIYANVVSLFRQSCLVLCSLSKFNNTNDCKKPSVSI